MRRQRRVFCPTCRDSFPDERSLRQHQKSLDDHPFCDKCDRSFRSFDALNQHFADLSDTHAFCEVCDRAFGSFKALNQHYAALPDHPFCQACSRRFTSFESLDQHCSSRNDHPFCDECNRSFNSFQALDRHLEGSSRHYVSPTRSTKRRTGIGFSVSASTAGLLAGMIQPSDTPQLVLSLADPGIRSRPIDPPTASTVAPEMGPQDTILSDWSGRGQHVEYERGTDVPLTLGRYLGHGSSGDVYEVICQGVALARKLTPISRYITQEDLWNEIDIIEKLRHRHVVRLIGSYRRGRVLGILIWPVAVCDLASFLIELDEYPEPGEYMEDLGLDPSPDSKGGPQDPLLFLRGLYGCLANTVEYLHANKVRHKDIKPNNVLLTKDGLYLADFGISRDLTDRSQSITDGPRRGTYKYCAPEVARYALRGKAADIYSLGCIFLELSSAIYALNPAPLLADFDTTDGISFQSNPRKLTAWVKQLDQKAAEAGGLPDSRFFTELTAMLSEDPGGRPTAEALARKLYEIGGTPSSLHARCCGVACG